MTNIIKRDGRTVLFDIDKVSNAIYRAAHSVGGSDKEVARNLAMKVAQKVKENLSDTFLTSL